MNAIAEIDESEVIHATTEIDKAGRIVVPKKLRDSLHLTAGTRITFRLNGNEIVIAPESKPRGLYMDQGTLVYDPGPAPPIDVLDWIKKDREDRINKFSAVSDRR